MVHRTRHSRPTNRAHPLAFLASWLIATPLWALAAKTALGAGVFAPAIWIFGLVAAFLVAAVLFLYPRDNQNFEVSV